MMDCLNIIVILFVDARWVCDGLLEYYRNPVC